MAFRSDLEAAHARMGALEGEMAELQAENARLRGEDVPGAEPTADPRDSGRRFRRTLKRAMVGGTLVLLAGAVAAMVLGQTVIGAVLVLALVWVLGGLGVLLTIVEIVPPGFVLVLSGRKRVRYDGARVGYRVVGGGRTMRIPILETSDLLDCRVRSIEAAVQSAYSKGGVPLAVDMSARIKINSAEPIVDNAIDRFLGRDMSEIDRVARETLEGHMRGLIAALTKDEICEDQTRFATRLIGEAEPDLRDLGIDLDSVAIKSVISASD